MNTRPLGCKYLSSSVVTDFVTLTSVVAKSWQARLDMAKMQTDREFIADGRVARLSLDDRVFECHGLAIMLQLRQLPRQAGS